MPAPPGTRSWQTFAVWYQARVAYSLRFKRVVLVDVIVLSVL
jgi:hypothetical protein